MSNDNYAIEIDPPDDVEYDVEAGINSSTCALMHSFEEERPTSLVASIRESARSSKRKVKYYFSFIFTPIKNLVANFKLLIIIGLYSFAGAHLFMYLEVPTDLAAKEDGYHQRKIAREVMVLNLRAIHYDNREDREERWKHAILKFEADMGLDEPVIETVWTFWMSFLYAGTIFTTIGYGNIACKTQAGQIATMIYAFAGIPIMLVMLTSLNNFLLKWIKIITNGFCDILLYIGVRLGVTVIRQEEVQKRLRYTRIARKMHQWKLSKNGAGSIAISSSEENRLNSDEDEEEDMQLDPPVFSTLFATVSWIMLSAAVFCLFEDWTFFTSFYFCFISLTTIGLGDVTPANPEYMIATFGVVLVGLSMLTVCIDVIKEKLALMYMALLQKLLNDYMEAVKSGDPNAASAMMAGFQGKAKFLMPLISKNEGAKVMNKFKEDCTKKGIDPPPVLTNINPETGMPAFANASRDEFNDYIEVAEERFAEEQQRAAQTPLSKSTDFLSPPPSRKPSVTVARVSLEVQAGTTMGKFHDLGSQTYVQESSDEGIQTDFEPEQEQKEAVVMADAGTQYEIVILTSIGIQPEVSSIYHGAEFGEESSSSEEDDSGSDWEKDDDDSDHPLPFEVADPGVLAFGLQSPPIEITPFSDEESGTSHSSPRTEGGAPMKLTPAKVEKSASMDSTDTVIHVKPLEISMERRVKINEVAQVIEEAEDQKKRHKKKKTRKTRKAREHREHELRFLKNSGNQTSPILLDCATQYEYIGKSRKCQTKLSSINHEQLQGIRQKLKRRESEMSRTTGGDSDWVEESETENVAEVSLDLSVIALGVDESGKVVEVPPIISTPSVDASVSVSPSEKLNSEMDELEEIESLEELELFTTDSGVQTDEKLMMDRQAVATPKLLEITRNCSSQTTFSTFHIPQKVYESASTSTSGDEDEKDPEDVQEKKEDEHEVFFMTNSAVQTMHTSFHLEEPVRQPQDVTENIEDVRITEEELLQKHSEELVFMKSTDCQTELESTTCSTSTEDVRFAVDKELKEIEIQTENRELKDSKDQTTIKIVLDTTVQTEPPDVVDEKSQTDMSNEEEKPVKKEMGIEIETQTEPPVEQLEVTVQTDSFSFTQTECQTDQPIENAAETSNSTCQTEIPLKSEAEVQAVFTVENAPVECQTETAHLEEAEVQTVAAVENSAVGCQTEAPHSQEAEVQAVLTVDNAPVECQTETARLEEAEVQAVLTVESSPVECQTETAHLEEAEMQTELETLTSESQTEKVEVDSIEMQTDTVESTIAQSQTENLQMDDTEMQTDQMDTVTNEMQTDGQTVSLQYTQTDEFEISPKVDVIDSVTQSDPLTETLDSQTQYTPAGVEDRDVQAKPISFDTQTQHSIESDAKSCQTELVRMKNKRSQEEDVTHSSTMTVTSSEEKEVQVDDDCFEVKEEVPKYDSGPLWSDFDYTPVIGEDEIVTEGKEEVENEEEEEEEIENDGEKEEEEEEEEDKDFENSESNLESEDFENATTSSSLDKKKRKKRITSSKIEKSSKANESSPTSVNVPKTVKTGTSKKRNEEKNVEARVETSTSTVQATTEMCEQSAGGVGEDDWLQVYVQELDEERRLRMSDIGIQTGVLARVQHMYTRPISDAVEATSSAPITLRKSSDSSEHISVRTAKSSEESLAPSAVSGAESMDDHLWAERGSPFASRHGSMKVRKRAEEGEKKSGDKTNIVQDLRAKFEMKSPNSPKDDDSTAGPSSRHFF